MKYFYITILFILCLNLAGCKKQSENIIYFAPNQLEKCCLVDGDVLLNIDNKLMNLNSDLSNISSYLSPNTQDLCLLDVSEYCIGVHYTNNKIYLATISTVAFGTKLQIDTYDKNFSNQKKLLEVKEYEIVNAIMDNQYCYYTISGSSMGGNGMSIMRIKLEENAVPELLWEDGGYEQKIYIDGFHTYDNLLIFTVNYGPQSKLNVYNTQNESWIIQDNSEMAYASYASGTLVYYTPQNSSINIYDLQSDIIKCSFDFSLWENICVSCDEDYIYIDASGSSAQKIWIYDFEGTPVDIIELKNVITNYNESKNQYYSAYMCSTKELLFIGKQTAPDTNAIYVLKKSEIGSNEDITIYALTNTL